MMHSDRAGGAAFDMALVPWPMIPAAVIKDAMYGPLQQERSTTVMKKEYQFEEEKLMDDPEIFEEHRYLRGKIHADRRELKITANRPWSAMPSKVIEEDVCSSAQQEVHQKRELRCPLSRKQVEKRRAVLQNKLSGFGGNPATNPRFFAEVYPVLEKETALAEARARIAMEKLHKAHAHDEAAELGAKFVVWPVSDAHRWPKPCSAWTQHSQWFAKKRATRRARQATARKWAQLCKNSVKSHGNWVAASPWLRFVRKLSSSTSSTSTCQSSDSCQAAESDWEALSDCRSDSSWQVGCELNDDSECNDANFWNLVPDTSQVVERIDKLNLSFNADGKLSLE